MAAAVVASSVISEAARTAGRRHDQNRQFFGEVGAAFRRRIFVFWLNPKPGNAHHT
jgi:hypothetical protein